MGLGIFENAIRVAFFPGRVGEKGFGENRGMGVFPGLSGVAPIKKAGVSRLLRSSNHVPIPQDLFGC